MSDFPESELTRDRRGFFEASLAALVLPLGCLRVQAADAFPSAAAGTGTGEEKTATKSSVKDVFVHDLPNVSMDGWQLSAAEVTTPPGPGSARHRHPGFVIGYVIEGDLRFQVAGQPEQVIPAGGMFYEAPGDVHAVSASASPTKPVRFLAMILAPKGVPLMTPA